MMHFRKSSRYTLLMWHFLICSLGLVAISQGVGHKLGLIFSQKEMIWFFFTDAVLQSIDHFKASSLLQYIFSILALFSYYITLSVMFKRIHPKSVSVFYLENHFSTKNLVYLILLIGLNVAFFLFMTAKISLILPAIIIWLGVSFLPLLPLGYTTLTKFGNNTSKTAVIFCYLLLISLALQFFYMFTPYSGSGNLKLSSDYFGMPEQTYLNNQYVDNKTYIKAHNIGGLFSVAIPFIKQPLYVKQYVVGTSDISGLYCQYITADECGVLVDYKLDPVKKFYSSEEQEFTQKNSYELTNQLVAGHYFHHQNAFLGPINEYLLGKPIQQINFFYGYGNSMVLIKLMKLIGGFDFQHYIKVLFAFYPIYLLTVIIAAGIIFRNIWYVLGITLAYLISVNLIGFEAIRYAPGNNPLRHFLDMFILVGLCQYLKSTSYRHVYLGITLIFSLLAILASKEFGLIIFLSLSVALTCYFIVNKKSWLDVAIFLLAILGACKLVGFLSIQSADSLAIYGYIGATRAPTGNIVSALVAIFITLIYGLLFADFIKNKVKTPLFFLKLFLFFYVQGVLVYFIWYTEPGHFLSTSIAVIFLLALLLREGLSLLPKSLDKALLKLMVFGFLLIIYMPSLICYYISWDKYEAIFANHKIYQWDFTRANFLSTMNPAPFSNSIQLIQQYSTNNAIYIISRFDNFLPFLAGRYSAMPYLQLDLSIVTKKELYSTIAMIKAAKPKYIFVDSNIKDDHFSEVLNPNDAFSLLVGSDSLMPFNLSLGRVLTLLNLTAVFQGIQKDYQPIVVGELITVYQRRT